MSVQTLTNDPIYQPKTQRNWLERQLLKLINDPRDLPFLTLCIQSTLIVIPFAIYLYLPGRFNWILGGLYFFVNSFFFMDRFILMLHCTSHRSLFKRRIRWMNHYIPWVLGPIFGETPDTYYAHHIGMHHPENNLHDDLSSTLRFQRDSFWGFLRYHLRFFFGIIFDLTRYHLKRRRTKLIRRMLVGEIGYYLIVAFLFWLNWRATIAVCVVPFFFCRFVMMAGNWAQHAFVDLDAPDNCYRNSLNVINCRYNRRCFNDGYHIGHHIKPNRHWTEMPVEFEENIEQYAAEKAIVFEGIDFLGVWFCLMLKRYDWLAKRYVPLDGQPKDHDAIITLLKQRTRRAQS